MRIIPERFSPRRTDPPQDVVSLERKLDELLCTLEPLPYQQPGAELGAPVGISTYWETLKRRKLVVLLTGLLLAAAAWFYSSRQPKLYEARTTLEILEPNRGSMNMQNFSSGPGSLFNLETYMETQFSLLRSRSLLNRVGRSLVNAGVISERDLAGSYKPDSSEAGSFAESGGSALSLSRLTVTPVRGTRLVQIAYSANNPQLAAKTANAFASEYIQQDVDNRVNGAEQTRSWLEEELENSKSRLESSEAKLQEYARSSGLLFTSPKGNTAEQTEDKLQFLAQDLSEAQAKRASLEARYDTAVAAPVSKVDQADSPALHDIQARLLDLRRQRASVNAEYTPAYSKAKDLDAEIAALEDGEAREYKRWLAQLYSAYQTELTHEKLLTEEYKKQADVVSDQASKAIHYNVLKREVETNRNLYDALLAGMKEAGVNASARVRNARIVDPAEPPEAPYSPQPVRTAAVGLIAGLTLGAAFVLLRDTGDRRVRNPGVAPTYLNVPELGVIPSADPRLLTSARLDLNRKDRNFALEGSQLSDAFHSVVTSILSPYRSSDVPRVLLVASGTSHEGKTTIIGNLGLMAAQIGRRVVAIDGDLRNPSLHRLHKVGNEKGLADLLREQNEIPPETLLSCIRPTEAPNLSLLTAGSTGDNIASLLNSPRLPEIIARLRDNFDLVLIDTPPVLPFPDARIIGKTSDAVILVMRAGQTTRDLALAAKARFIEDGLPVFGTILNAWSRKDAPYAYNSYYAYEK